MKVDLRSALHLPLQPLPLLPRHPRRTVTVLLLEYPHLLDSLSHWVVFTNIYKVHGNFINRDLGAPVSPSGRMVAKTDSRELLRCGVNPLGK